MSRKALMMISGGLIALGISVLLFPFLILGYSSYMSQKLREEAASLYSTGNFSTQEDVQLSSKDGISKDTKKSSVNLRNSNQRPSQTGLYPESLADSIARPEVGEIVGQLSIPTLSIEEAILEGTGQQELAKATGHLQGSVFPGQVGTSVIAAHNATIFRKIDQLSEGMEFTVTTDQGVFTFSVTGQRILNVNDSLPNRAYPSVTLETCYPLDALYLTDKRFFVEAALVKRE